MEDNNDNNKYDEVYGTSQQNDLVFAQLKSAQTLITVAIISGIVSFIIGGIFLSIVALICAVMAYTKVKDINTKNTEFKDSAVSLKNKSYFAIGIAATALILNAISLALIMPMVMELIQSGDVDSFMNSVYGSSSTSSSASTSVWG